MLSCGIIEVASVFWWIRNSNHTGALCAQRRQRRHWAQIFMTMAHLTKGLGLAILGDLRKELKGLLFSILLPKEPNFRFFILQRWGLL
jgi:hypothetical protein